MKRGYYSFLILALLILFTCLGPLLVGNRALVVKYNGQYIFPVLKGFIPGSDFGLDYHYETEYRTLKKQFAADDTRNWLIMPLVPFSPKEVESPEAIYAPVENKNGTLFYDGEILNEGRVFSVYSDGKHQREWLVTDGALHGNMRGFDASGKLIEKAHYEHGKRVSYQSLTESETNFRQNPNDNTLFIQNAFPTKPGIGGHLLGTDESGRDVLARLFYGFQTMCLASVIFLCFVYFISISIGCAMGYFGGSFDIISQRFIEIWSNIPFLYIVIILSAIITPNLFWLMLIMVAFSWMGLTSQMRTSTYREKERDYIAAARVLGMSTTRIIFKHILPNSISTVITFGPFLVAGVISSLTALDFLGFGLPRTEPTWGEMLKQGTDNMGYPWILGCVFISLVTVLVLVTFIGEAIREAFDPKKYTTYR